MKQESDNPFLPLKTQKAAARLSDAINIDCILSYAVTRRDPQELKFIKQMISDLGLRGRCRKADVAECVGFVDRLIQQCYQPNITVQKNDGCQLFFGDVLDSDFHSNNKKRKCRKV